VTYCPKRRFRLANAFLDAWELSERYRASRSTELLREFQGLAKYIRTEITLRKVGDAIPEPYDIHRENLL
jgi:hypothetical protein